MNESVLDVLVYLFENYYLDDEPAYEAEQLAAELCAAGFAQNLVAQALSWLQTLSAERERGDMSRQPMRIYTSAEAARLGAEGHGFLQLLENEGILEPAAREIVIDRVMALDCGEVDLESLKWIILVVLFNQPDTEDACAWVENLLLEMPAEHCH